MVLLLRGLSIAVEMGAKRREFVGVFLHLVVDNTLPTLVRQAQPYYQGTLSSWYAL